MKSWSLVPILATLISYGVFIAAAAAVDANENCENWADIGECDKNPGFMLSNCATSCDKAAKQALADAKELEGIQSFFNLSAQDIHGNVIDFSRFKGQVTIVVNVASYCGYTDGHYKQLVQLWSQVKSSGKINILAFPCNQFGAQEPDSNDEIHEFAFEHYGVDFQMMAKIDVNGAGASPVYKYLKKLAGPNTIGWNFATYYIVSPDGSVESHSGVEPLQLKDLALEKLAGDEL